MYLKYHETLPVESIKKSAQCYVDHYTFLKTLWERMKPVDITDNYRFENLFNIGRNENLSMEEVVSNNSGIIGNIDNWIAEQQNVLDTIDATAVEWESAMAILKTMETKLRGVSSKYYGG